MASLAALASRCSLPYFNRDRGPMQGCGMMSRLQTAQLFMVASLILSAIGFPTVLFGAIAVGVFCLVLAYGCASTGCYLLAEVKGYPPLIGIPIGLIFGVFGGIIMMILPDETQQSTYAIDREMAQEGIKNARKRDKGYEVLDDDDD
jgi:uncharacterized membrane protein YedE/YeeE